MYDIAAFYRFAPVPEPGALAAALRTLGQRYGLCGTVIVASEGVNGTVAGGRAGIERLLARIGREPGFDALSPRWSQSAAAPFAQLKIRRKAEIVTMGRPDIAPARSVGQYVDPADWNALIAAPDVAVIDTRNDYEVAIGSFQGAIDPATPSFRDFPDWWQQNRDRLSGRRIAMFCTGGIRCEKATSYLRAEGVAEVYHLKGGILGYLDAVPEAESLWQGACFVFDERVSVGHGLVPGSHGLCRGCRRPVAPEAYRDPQFEVGVSCPRCYSERTEADRARFRERQRQRDLAAARAAAQPAM